MTYTYTNTLIEDENATIVKGYDDSTLELTSKNYIKTRRQIKTVTFIKYKGIKLPQEEYKLVNIPNIGLVVIFPLELDKTGAVHIMYWPTTDKQPLEEIINITEYKESAPGIEGPIQNYIIARQYPVTNPSVAYPITITTKNNEEVVIDGVASVEEA